MKRESRRGSKGTPPALAVGSRVRTTDDRALAGEIVEDFGDLAGTEVVIDDAHTARARRWAVALDDGQLVFVDDDGIELLEDK